MPYSVQSQKTGATYYLHSKETESRGGKRKLYFFRKEIQDGAEENLPDGTIVTENMKTGLPLLKRAEAK